MLFQKPVRQLAIPVLSVEPECKLVNILLKIRVRHTGECSYEDTLVGANPTQSRRCCRGPASARVWKTHSYAPLPVWPSPKPRPHRTSTAKESSGKLADSENSSRLSLLTVNSHEVLNFDTRTLLNQTCLDTIRQSWTYPPTCFHSPTTGYCLREVSVVTTLNVSRIGRIAETPMNAEPD